MKNVPMSVLFVGILISLMLGLFIGFFLGVASTEAGAEFIEDIMTSETAADISNPKKIIHERYEFEYPKNWKIDDSAEDYDPDQNFSIESPGENFATYIISDDVLTPKEQLKIQADTYSELLSNSTKSPIKSYGQYAAEGSTLKGAIYGIKFTIRIISFQVEDMVVTIIQQYTDDEEKLVLPGFNLIEKSFVLKPAPPPVKKEN